MIYILVYDGTNWQTDISSAILLIPSSDQTNATNIAQNILGVSFYMQANSVYSFRGYIHIGCNNTGGVKFAIETPGSLFMNFIGTTTNNTTFGSFNAILTNTLIATAFCQENQSARGVQINGTITTVAAGTAYFRFASGTNGQTSTVFKEGSFILVNKIG